MGAQTPKTPKQLERHLKGVANHWRIGILRLVAAQSGITLEVICKNLKGEYKTLSVHTQRLVHAGLVEKKYKGNSVEHFLTPYGKRFHDFLKAF
ncbi:transcriptional regulator [Candidatus Kaiserbacteria bacterium]|nr:transcriptional regulator [Candidatus Kaiserbacteria bacterium]